MLAKILDFQDQNINSASAEYPPLSFVILGSHILRNSLDACAATAADTSAAIVAACLDSSIRGTLGPMSNVLSFSVVHDRVWMKI